MFDGRRVRHGSITSLFLKCPATHRSPLREVALRHLCRGLVRDVGQLPPLRPRDGLVELRGWIRPLHGMDPGRHPFSSMSIRALLNELTRYYRSERRSKRLNGSGGRRHHTGRVVRRSGGNDRQSGWRCGHISPLVTCNRRTTARLPPTKNPWARTTTMRLGPWVASVHTTRAPRCAGAGSLAKPRLWICVRLAGEWSRIPRKPRDLASVVPWPTRKTTANYLPSGRIPQP